VEIKARHTLLAPQRVVLHVLQAEASHETPA
jgi:hypothetical protein